MSIYVVENKLYKKYKKEEIFFETFKIISIV